MGVTGTGRDGTGEGAYERIFAVVRRIPEGRVATYGQVAALAGLPGRARQVGYALHTLDDSTSVPWHRVINSKGQVSPRSEAGWERFQRHLLEGEDVEFDERGRIDLQRFRWEPPERVGADWRDLPQGRC